MTNTVLQEKPIDEAGIIDFQPHNIGNYYSVLADYYYFLSMDRDFAGQTSALMSAHGTADGRFVELFAGPAYHTKHFLDRGMEGFAIDSSAEMQNIAHDRLSIPKKQYVVDRLPGAVARLEGEFDVFFILRFSVGYLTLLELSELFWQIQKKARENASVFFECHNIPSIVDGLPDLSIRERAVRLPDGRSLVCQWPSGPLTWQRDSFTVVMPVKVTVLDDAAKAVVETHRFESRERIFTFEEIAFVAKGAGASAVRIVDDGFGPFGESTLVHVRL